MDVAASAIATAAASLAAVVDVRSRRIPNWLTVGLVVGGVLLSVWRNGPAGVWMPLAGATLGLAILLPFYALRAIGAGDVKLLAGLGAVLGPQLLVSLAMYAALAGGVISVILLASSGRLWSVLREIFVEHRPPTRGGLTAPYGVAIASGMYLTLVLPSVFG
jgi:prepilin peptidase CpaA